jgi:hypothetical protein
MKFCGIILKRSCSLKQDRRGVSESTPEEMALVKEE